MVLFAKIVNILWLFKNFLEKVSSQMFDRVRNTPLEMYLVVEPSPHTHQKTIRPQVKKEINENQRR